ncbi:hypothetical protein GLA29479_2157 [Lysobacter antibioticus]|nr:hypothetical protein GLA29479_2157 [Lysobacter antibioticus]
MRCGRRRCRHSSSGRLRDWAGRTGRGLLRCSRAGRGSACCRLPDGLDEKPATARRCLGGIAGCRGGSVVCCGSFAGWTSAGTVRAVGEGSSDGAALPWRHRRLSRRIGGLLQVVRGLDKRRNGSGRWMG